MGPECTRGRPRRRPSRRAAWLAIAAAPFVVAPAAAARDGNAGAPKQEDVTPPAGLDVTVQTGMLGTFRPPGDLLVVVELASEALVTGEVAVETGGVRRVADLEVPGGGRKSFEFRFPTYLGQGDANVTVEVLDGEASLLFQDSTRVRAARAPIVVVALDDQTVVDAIDETGATGGADADVLAADAFTPELLGLADLLVTSADQVAASALDWVRRGGVLAVTGATDPAGLADDATPAVALGASVTGARLGAGILLGVGDDPDWAAVLRPLPGDTGAPGFFAPPVGGVVAGGGDFGLRSVRWLAVFLAVYALVAVPASFLILGRLRRRDLAWVTMPSMGVAFAIAAFAIAGADRPADEADHGVAIIETAAGVTATGTFTLVAASSGDHEFRLPEGAAVGGAQDPSGMITPVAADIRDAGGSTLVEAELATAQAIFAHATWAPASPGLSGEVRVAGAAAEYTVRNDGEHTLEGAVVMLGEAAIAEVGALAPGEERTGTFELRPAPWSYPNGPGLAAERITVQLDQSDPIVQSAWSLTQLAAGGVRGFAKPGHPFLLGFVSDIAVDASAAAPSEGPGLLGAELSLTVETGADVAAGVATADIVSYDGPGAGGDPFAGAVFGATEATLRYLLPPGVHAQTVRLARPQQEDFPGLVIGEAFDWTTGDWIAEPPDGGAFPASVVSPLGEVLVRYGLADADNPACPGCGFTIAGTTYSIEVGQ